MTSKNFLYQKPYINGYPDKKPDYYKVQWFDKSIGQVTHENTMLLSPALTVKHLLYYVANEIDVDVEWLEFCTATAEG